MFCIIMTYINFEGLGLTYEQILLHSRPDM